MAVAETKGVSKDVDVEKYLSSFLPTEDVLCRP
jgi:hypothetical protein